MILSSTGMPFLEWRLNKMHSQETALYKKLFTPLAVASCLAWLNVTPVQADSRYDEADVARVTSSARSLTPKAVGALKTASSVLSGAADQLEKANKAGELKEFANYVGKLQKLGKVAQGLGMMGSAVNVLLTIGQKSETQQIISEIKKVDAHISALSARMDNRFDELEAYEALLKAQGEVSGPLTKISAATEAWQLYQNDIQNLKGGADAHQLSGRNVSQIFDAATAVADQCAGGNLHTPILQAAETYTDGDMPAVLQLGHLLVMRMTEAQRVYAALYALDLADGDTPPADIVQKASEASARDFQSHVKDCVDAVEQSFLRLNRQPIVSRHVKAAVPKLVEGLSSWSTKGAAKEIGQALERKHPLYDFMVIVYEPVEGFDNHSLWHGSSSIQKYAMEGPGKVKRNLIVAWAPRGTDHKTTFSGGCGDFLISYDETAKSGIFGDNYVSVTYKQGGKQFEYRQIAMGSASSFGLGYVPQKLNEFVQDVCSRPFDTVLAWTGRKSRMPNYDIHHTRNAGTFTGSGPQLVVAALEKRRPERVRIPRFTGSTRIYFRGQVDKCITNKNGSLELDHCNRDTPLETKGEDLRRFNFSAEDDVIHTGADRDKCLGIEGDVSDNGRNIVVMSCDGNQSVFWRKVGNEGVFFTSANRRNVCLAKAQNSNRVVTRHCGKAGIDAVAWQIEEAP